MQGVYQPIHILLWMHSHVSTVTNAQAEYIMEITADHCKKIHLTGIFSITANNFIYGLKINQTTFRPFTFAGSTTSDGQCSGAQYSDTHTHNFFMKILNCYM